MPAPRHRNRFASEPLPAPASFNEADVSDKPTGIRNRAVIGPARINAIRENYQQRLESLLAVDEAIRDIVAALDASGEMNRTLIVFTADNGFFHGEHRVQAGKVLVYEPSVRVPLIIRGPGVPAGARRSSLVANIDLAPTILDAANARAGTPAGRPLAAPVRAGRAAPVGQGRPAGDADLQRDPHAALRVRPARERRAGALRPRPRPAAAPEPARRRAVHRAEDRSRRAARTRFALCRRHVSPRPGPAPPGALSARVGRLRPLDRPPARSAGRPRRGSRPSTSTAAARGSSATRGRRSPRPCARRGLRTRTLVRALVGLRDSRSTTLDRGSASLLAQLPRTFPERLRTSNGTSSFQSLKAGARGRGRGGSHWHR